MIIEGLVTLFLFFLSLLLFSLHLQVAAIH